MLGFIKKDFLLIKANLKTLMVLCIVFFIMVLQGSFDVTFVMPLIGIMLFISTFSYDEFNNWNGYASTLPMGRKNVVKAKYIESILLMSILAILAFVVAMLISYVKTKEIHLDEILASLMGTILSIVIVISFLCPIVFKFGVTNGRIILFALVFGIVGIVALMANFIDRTFIINTINKLEYYLNIAMLIFSFLLLGISYLLSNKIYQNKEF